MKTCARKVSCISGPFRAKSSEVHRAPPPRSFEGVTLAYATGRRHSREPERLGHLSRCGRFCAARAGRLTS